MKVTWKDPADAAQLQALIDSQASAKQRDRYRVVLLAGQGLGNKARLQREEIAQVAGRSRQFVDEWVGRYRRGGIEALLPRRQKGAACKLGAGQQRQMCKLLDEAWRRVCMVPELVRSVCADTSVPHDLRVIRISGLLGE